jgi:hypothetical protein
VIWLDGNIHNEENREYRLLLEDKFKHQGFSFADSIDQVINFINSSVKVVLIVSGAMGRILLPKIHFLKNVYSIIIFCYNVEYHSTWAKDYEKVKLVTDDFDEALIESEIALNKALFN